MKCVGKFKFKQIQKRAGGTFVNSAGETIEYKDSFQLKVDESTEKGFFERNFKISTENTNLINALMELKPYTDITIEFDVNIYGSRVSLIPISMR